MNPWLQARNILAVRLDNIGDVVMLSPALRAVKRASPAARITLLAGRAGATAAPLLSWVDDVMVLRSVWQDLGHLAFDPARELALVQELAARRFDAALIFTSFSQTPHAPGYLCYLAGIPLRAGESKEFGGAVLSTELRGAPDGLQQAECNLRLVEAVGFPVKDRHLEVRVPDADRESAPRLLDAAGIDPRRPFVLIHPGASCEARRYPAVRFGQVAGRLIERGWPVLVTGVEKEAEIVGTVVAGAPGAVSLLGGTTLGEYAAIVERAAAVVCGNTLPIHLADALDTPVVALYSGTDLESQWRPRRVPHRLLRRETNCHPCYRFACPIGLPCLDIDPSSVADAVEELARCELPGAAGVPPAVSGSTSTANARPLAPHGSATTSLGARAFPPAPVRLQPFGSGGCEDDGGGRRRPRPQGGAADPSGASGGAPVGQDRWETAGGAPAVPGNLRHGQIGLATGGDQ